MGFLGTATNLFMSLFADPPPPPPDTTFGSSRMATLWDISDAGLFRGGGYTLGFCYFKKARAYDHYQDFASLRYSGDRHRLVVAPARSGKFVSCVGPMLLDKVNASAFVLDVKGEAAIITRAHRATGGPVYLINPFNQFQMGTQGYNPMLLLDRASRSIVADAQLLTEAFVDTAHGADRHFEDEGRNLIQTLILYVAAAPEEADKRTLNRVRTLLTLPASKFAALMKRLITSDLAFGAVRQGAASFDQKMDREASGVLSTAQRMTAFLMDPQIKAVLRRDDFRFGDLKREVGTVYLIIPPSRISTHNTFLRLLVTAAAIEFERVPLATPNPVHVILDEFPLIGRLRAVEKAYSVQAGYGVQFHIIAQHFGQLRDAYGPFWETFVSSAGIVQVFDTNDQFTAEYVSKLCGSTTTFARSDNFTTSVSRQASGASSSTSSSESFAPTGRRLIMPDEVRSFRHALMPDASHGRPQLILPSGGYPIAALRWKHYEDFPFSDRALKAPLL